MGYEGLWVNTGLLKIDSEQNQEKSKKIRNYIWRYNLNQVKTTTQSILA
jgi:hypothetical protein